MRDQARNVEIELFTQGNMSEYASVMLHDYV